MILFTIVVVLGFFAILVLTNGMSFPAESGCGVGVMIVLGAIVVWAIGLLQWLGFWQWLAAGVVKALQWIVTH